MRETCCPSFVCVLQQLAAFPSFESSVFSAVHPSGGGVQLMWISSLFFVKFIALSGLISCIPAHLHCKLGRFHYPQIDKLFFELYM
ncbi:hypothetical protein S245_008256 [Arachis hypogaea]